MKLSSQVKCFPCWQLIIVSLGTMRQAALDQDWLEALSPKWPLPALCKWSCVWNTPTPACSPGRSETSCCWSECATMTAYPASAPSTGNRRPYVCLTTQIIRTSVEWSPSVFTGSSETKSTRSLVKLVSHLCLSHLFSLGLTCASLMFPDDDLWPCSVISFICFHGNRLFLWVRLFHQWDSGNQEVQQTQRR